MFYSILHEETVKYEGVENGERIWTKHTLLQKGENLLKVRGGLLKMRKQRYDTQGLRFVSEGKE